MQIKNIYGDVKENKFILVPVNELNYENFQQIGNCYDSNKTVFDQRFMEIFGGKIGFLIFKPTVIDEMVFKCENPDENIYYGDSLERVKEISESKKTINIYYSDTFYTKIDDKWTGLSLVNEDGAVKLKTSSRDQNSVWEENENMKRSYVKDSQKYFEIFKSRDCKNNQNQTVTKFFSSLK